MLRTFNCGIGMVICCATEDAAKITSTLESHGETVQKIGSLHQNTNVEGNDQVHFSGSLNF